MKKLVNHDAPPFTGITRIPEADVMISGGMSLFVVDAITKAAQDWVSENISDEGYNPELPHRVYVEHRYISDVVSGMRRAGLVVR